MILKHDIKRVRVKLVVQDEGANYIAALRETNNFISQGTFYVTQENVCMSHEKYLYYNKNFKYILQKNILQKILCCPKEGLIIDTERCLYVVDENLFDFLSFVKGTGMVLYQHLIQQRIICNKFSN